MQFHLNDDVAYLIYVQKWCVGFFFFPFLTGGGEGDLFFIIPGENCTSVFTRNILMMKNDDNSDGREIWAC